MHTFDVTVVGAGVIGCAIACELSRRDFHVLVIDRQEPGREASWAAAGMLSPAPHPADSPGLLPLAKASYDLYPEFVSWIESLSGTATCYQHGGALHLFAGKTGENSRDELIAEYKQLGVSVEPISIRDARQREPLLGSEIAAAAWIRDEASLDPRALMRCAFEAARKLGVEFRTDSGARSILLNDGRCEGVVTQDSKIFSAHTIIAAGCFSSTIEGVAIYAPTRPVRGQMLSLQPAGGTLKHVVLDDRAYMVPRPDGRIVAGSTIENAGYEKCVTPAGMMRILGPCIEMAPSLAEVQIAETWSGLRPGTPDDLPIIGPTDMTGLLIATGHYRNGILLAPITARLAGAFLSREQLPLDWSRYSPMRFAEPQATMEVKT